MRCFKNIAQLIKTKRLHHPKSYSQSELSHLLGYKNGQFISNVERALCNVPLKMLGKVSEVLAIDPKYFRPTEVDLLIGDPTKAKEKLGWEPQIQLAELVEDMMSSDLKLMQKDKYLEDGGYQTLNYFE